MTIVHFTDGRPWSFFSSQQQAEAEAVERAAAKRAEEERRWKEKQEKAVKEAVSFHLDTLTCVWEDREKLVGTNPWARSLRNGCTARLAWNPLFVVVFPHWQPPMLRSESPPAGTLPCRGARAGFP